MQAQIMQMQAANQQMQTPATKHVVPPSKGAAVQRQVENPEHRQPAVQVPDGPFSQVKRPKGSYFMFHHEQSTILRNQNPNSTTVEIAKLTGERWHALTETEKKKYQDMALVDKQRYEREIREEAAANFIVFVPLEIIPTEYFCTPVQSSTHTELTDNQIYKSGLNLFLANHHLPLYL